ncbi:putative signal transducing protein [Fusibacter bizertensis]
MTFLATVDDNIEIEMLREVFENNNITLMVKHRETGEFMMISAGMSMFGSDIYVNEDEYDRAIEIYNAYFNIDHPIPDDVLEELALEAAPNPDESETEE